MSAEIDHERAEALFSDAVDETLPAAERAALDAHLAGCERCRGELEAFKRTIAAIHGAAREAPSPEFMDSLRAQIRTRSRGRFFGERKRSYRLEIASLVTLVIALAIYVALHLARPMLGAP